MTNLINMGFALVSSELDHIDINLCVLQRPEEAEEVVEEAEADQVTHSREDDNCIPESTRAILVLYIKCNK